MVDGTLALDGIKVVELPCFDPMPFLAAAMAGKLLADFGAEVIKIEPPGIGAAERRWGTFRGEERNPETNALHLYLNTNKLGVTIDLGEPAGPAMWNVSSLPHRTRRNELGTGREQLPGSLSLYYPA